MRLATRILLFHSSLLLIISSSASHVIPNNLHLFFFDLLLVPRLTSTYILPTFTWLLRHYVFCQIFRLNIFSLVFPAIFVTLKLSLRNSFQVLFDPFTQHLLFGVLVFTTCTVFFTYFVFNTRIYAPLLADSKRNMTKLLYRLDFIRFLTATEGM